MLRALVVGCGAIGAGAGDAHPDVGIGTHAGAYAACADTELVAVCDADPARAAAAAERWGAAAHTDVAAALATGPDLVSVCTPDATHADVVAAALRTPGVRGVLAEKPLAGDAAAARALGALAAERGIVLAVNYTRRFAPALRAVRERLADGALGELQHVSGSYVKGLRHNGTHWLDLLRMLAGEPQRVRGWDRLGEGGPDPSLDAELTLAGGVGARLAALDTRCFTVFEMDLIGTRGRLRVAQSGHVLEVAGVVDDPRHPGYSALSAAPETTTGALRDALLHAVEDLAGRVHDGGPPACGAPEGVAALALAEAIAASAAAGGEPRSWRPCAA